MKDEQPTRYFVTGGAGFIGSHVVDHLLSQGRQVAVYDNLVSGKRRWIASHMGRENFTFVQADLLDRETLERSMKGYEVVWHLGANTDIPKGNTETDLDLENCTIATYNVLEAMRATGIKKSLFASSATVYGDAPPQPLAETYGPLLPISLYGSAKLACEGLISAYCHLFAMQAWVFRFANVVGPRMGHGVIYDFIHKLRKNPRELEILGDGRQEKPYFLVGDCIEGMFCAFRSTGSASAKESFCDVFNLGCSSTVTVRRVAEVVAEEMGLKEVKFRYTGGRRGWPGDVPEVHFDVTKMAKLGWKVTRTAEEAVRLTAHALLEQP